MKYCRHIPSLILNIVYKHCNNAYRNFYNILLSRVGSSNIILMYNIIVLTLIILKMLGAKCNIIHNVLSLMYNIV